MELESLVVLKPGLFPRMPRWTLNRYVLRRLHAGGWGRRGAPPIRFGFGEALATKRRNSTGSADLDSPSMG